MHVMRTSAATEGRGGDFFQDSRVYEKGSNLIGNSLHSLMLQERKVKENEICIIFFKRHQSEGHFFNRREKGHVLKHP